MLYRSCIGGKQVALEFNAKLHASAEELVKRLRILNDKGPPLQAGSTIRYGWSSLTLRAESGFLRVCEPAFDGNPFEEISPTLNNTLKIFEEQASVLRRTGLSGVDVLFSDDLFVRNRALEAPNLFLKRQPPAGNRDSGWYIGNRDRIDVDGSDNSFEIIRVFKLLQRRPAVLGVLALPPDYLVLMRDDRVLEILDQEGKNHWNEPV